MKYQLKIKNYDPDAIERKVLGTIDDKETIMRREDSVFLNVIVLIASLFMIIIWLTTRIITVFKEPEIIWEPWNVILSVAIFVAILVIHVLSIVNICRGMDSDSDERYSFALQYHRLVNDKTLMAAECDCKLNGRKCEVQLTVADKKNAVMTDALPCWVVRKVDVTEPYLDVAAGVVYLPYQKPQA